MNRHMGRGVEDKGGERSERRWVGVGPKTDLGGGNAATGSEERAGQEFVYRR